MNWSARFSWLMALRAGREMRPAPCRDGEADMADMGTAFGLDASFDAVSPYACAPQRDASVPPSLASALESRLIRRSRL
jgi:hypothetical protein